MASRFQHTQSLHLRRIILHQLPTHNILIREMVNPPLHIITAPYSLSHFPLRRNEIRRTFPRSSDPPAYPTVGPQPSTCLFRKHNEHRATTPDVGQDAPSENDCFAIPLDASLPAKFPYIPSIPTKSHQHECLVHNILKPSKGSTYLAHRNSPPPSHQTPSH